MSSVSKFWSLVDKKKIDECWSWVGTINAEGYGVFRFSGRSWGAHRIAYSLAYGAIPKCDGRHGTLYILHSCDNPRCVNPAHLRAGTALDNTNDMVERGRWSGGNGGYNRKLSVEKETSVRSRVLSGESVYVLASEFGVTTSHILSVVNRYEKLYTRPINRKLSVSQEDDIVKRYRHGEVSMQRLADEFEVVPSTIFRVIKRSKLT